MRASIDIVPPSLGRGVQRIVEPGESLWLEGSPAATAALVLQGVALISRYDERECTEVPLGLAVPADLIGDEVLAGFSVRTTTVRALTRLRLHVVHADELHDRLRCDPSAGVAVSRLLAGHTITSARAAAASRDPLVEGRVVRWLVHLSEQLGGGDDAVVIPLGQAELAQLCATRRPTLNRILRSLAAAGAVHIGRGRIVVPSLASLRSVTDLLRHTAVAS